MHNQQQRYLKTNNIVSKFVVIVLSVVLLTGISLVPVLQIGVSAQQQQQPQPIIAIKITSPSTGQQVPVGELTISGTSTDNATSDCTVYADWNNTKPFQTAIATGPGGLDDYSTWTFTYTDDYHLITNGTNDITSKLSCVGDDSNIGTANLTKSYSVNVIGVPMTTSTNNTAGVTSTEQVQQQQQQESPTLDSNITTTKENNAAAATPPELAPYFQEETSVHNQQQHLKSNNIISKFAVIVLSIVLLTGLALVPTLQIGVNGQVQQQPQQQKQQQQQQQPQQQNQVGLSQVIKQIAQQVVTANPGTNAAQVEQILVQLAKQTAQTASKEQAI